MSKLKIPLFITIPHSGEEIPKEAFWLKNFSQKVLLTDVDRFVHELYAPLIQKFEIPAVIANVHRYVVDLNRYPEDVDCDSVSDSVHPSGKFTNGYHWVKTTLGEKLITQPLSRKTHLSLTQLYFQPFHDRIQKIIEKLKNQFPHQPIYHFDCHSMPSQGTDVHHDAGKTRPEIVLSDFHGQSCDPKMRDGLVEAFRKTDFEVSVNWPYYGGRITQKYGKPLEGHHTIQIELNRKLYLDEVTKQKLPTFSLLSQRLEQMMSVFLEIFSY